MGSRDQPSDQYWLLKRENVNYFLACLVLIGIVVIGGGVAAAKWGVRAWAEYSCEGESGTPQDAALLVNLVPFLTNIVDQIPINSYDDDWVEEDDDRRSAQEARARRRLRHRRYTRHKRVVVACPEGKALLERLTLTDAVKESLEAIGATFSRILPQGIPLKKISEQVVASRISTLIPKLEPGIVGSGHECARPELTHQSYLRIFANASESPNLNMTSPYLDFMQGLTSSSHERCMDDHLGTGWKVLFAFLGTIPGLVLALSFYCFLLTRAGQAQDHQTRAGQAQDHQTRAGQAQDHQTSAGQAQDDQTRADQARGNQTSSEQASGDPTGAGQARGSDRGDSGGFLGFPPSQGNGEARRSVLPTHQVPIGITKA